MNLKANAGIQMPETALESRGPSIAKFYVVCRDEPPCASSELLSVYAWKLDWSLSLAKCCIILAKLAAYSSLVC